jgi:hypothetical protein
MRRLGNNTRRLFQDSLGRYSGLSMTNQSLLSAVGGVRIPLGVPLVLSASGRFDGSVVLTDLSSTRVVGVAGKGRCRLPVRRWVANHLCHAAYVEVVRSCSGDLRFHLGSQPTQSGSISSRSGTTYGCRGTARTGETCGTRTAIAGSNNCCKNQKTITPITRISRTIS